MERDDSADCPACGHRMTMPEHVIRGASGHLYLMCAFCHAMTPLPTPPAA